MATDVQIIIDENSEAFYFSGWYTSRSPTNYGGTRRGTFSAATLEFSFEGTSAAIIGTSEALNQDVYIDGARFSTGGIYDSLPITGGTYRQLFQTPKLSDGKHTIAVTCVAGTQIDFAVVNVTAQDHLVGRDIITDNDDSSISYSGHWNRSTSRLNDTDSRFSYPYGNSTHRSSTPGDSFTFRFMGTSVSVYGIYSYFNLGTLGVTYTLDGVSSPQTYNVTSTNSSVSTNTSITYLRGELPQFEYYSKNNLVAGDHTLIVNITMANNLTFMLDYITYKASFVTPSSSISSVSTSSPSSSPSQVKASGAPQPGAIVGGIIGVLALGVLAAMLGRWMFLRRKVGQTDNISFYDDTNSLHIQNPNQYYRQPISQLPSQGHPSRQPLKFGRERPARLNPAERATASNSNLPPMQDPPDVDFPADGVANPPPYDSLSSVPPEVTQHITAI